MPVFDDRYLTTTKKIRTYGDNVYTNYSGLNVPKDGLNMNLLQSLLLILYLLMKANIAYKYNSRLSWWHSFSNWWRLVFDK